MPDNPEANKIRGDLLSRSSLLRSFLEVERLQTDRKQWIQDVMDHTVNLDLYIEQRLGYDWMRTTSLHVGIAFEELKIFHRSNPYDTPYKEISLNEYVTLMGIGFELGGSTSIELFLPQITEQLIRCGSINQKFLDDDPTHRFLRRAIRGILEVGAHLRMESDSPSPSPDFPTSPDKPLLH